MATGEEYTWIAHPDVVSTAIYILAATCTLLGGIVIKTFLHIDAKRMGMLESVAADVKKIAEDFQKYTVSGEHRLTEVEGRVRHLENETDDMRRLCEDRRQKGMGH